MKTIITNKEYATLQTQRCLENVKTHSHYGVDVNTYILEVIDVDKFRKSLDDRIEKIDYISRTGYLEKGMTWKKLAIAHNNLESILFKINKEVA